MSVAQAFETTATVNAPQTLHLDEPLPPGAQRVRVIVLLNGEEYDDSEISEEEWLKASSRLQALDFLNGEGEDIYTWEDGKPFNAAD
jgi:hypothetical protein